ncbi:MAG: hypothetical protein WED11_07670 [Natronospirillum sp.]
MRNSKIKLTVTAVLLAGSAGAFSVFADVGEEKGMMPQENMMSQEGMQGMSGMMGMMNMMSQMSDMMADMPPDDRKAMSDACMTMMQSQAGDNMMGNGE